MVRSMTLEDFFCEHEESRRLYGAVSALIHTLGPVDVRMTKSQVAFSRRKAFAWVWAPDQYLRGKHAPLVLSIALRRRDASPRWKQIVEPTPGRFLHHLELHSADALDAQVRGWLSEAWEAA